MTTLLELTRRFWTFANIAVFNVSSWPKSKGDNMAKVKEHKTVLSLLKSPNRWTQGNIAEDKAGNWVSATSQKACRWCLLGAIIRVHGYGTCIPDKLGMPEEDLTVWNDKKGRTHAEVLKFCRQHKI